MVAEPGNGVEFVFPRRVYVYHISFRYGPERGVASEYSVPDDIAPYDVDCDIDGSRSVSETAESFDPCEYFFQLIARPSENEL